MQRSVVNTGGDRQRSVKFKTVLSNASEFDGSITMDDLDPQVRHRDGSSPGVGVDPAPVQHLRTPIVSSSSTQALAGSFANQHAPASADAEERTPSLQSGSGSGVASLLRRFSLFAVPRPDAFTSEPGTEVPPAIPPRRASLFAARPPVASGLRRHFSMTFPRSGAAAHAVPGRAPPQQGGTAPGRLSRRAVLFSPRPTSPARALSATAPAYCLSPDKIAALRRVLARPAWRTLTLLSVAALLFGAPVRDAWLPRTADAAVRGLQAGGIAFLAADIVVRAIVDKAYFALRREGTGRRTDAAAWCRSARRAGSYLFWFDTLFLLFLAATVLYFHPTFLCDPVRVAVTLDEGGFPVAEASSLPTYFWAALFCAGRIGLMARFVRTSHVSELSGGATRYCAPNYWLLRLTRARQERRERHLAAAVAAAGAPVERDSFSVTQLEESATTLNRGNMRLSSATMERSVEEAGSLPVGGSAEATPHASTDSTTESRRRVGTAMRELTGQRIAIGAILAFLMIIFSEWRTLDTTPRMTMIVLHGQTANPKFAELSIDIARDSVIPSLFNYTRTNGTTVSYLYELGNVDVNDLREREKMIVQVNRKGSEAHTTGQFDISQHRQAFAKVEIVQTIFMLFLWVLAVASFAGPVMALVVEPIERMVRLLSMIMKDPLGYETTPQYRTLEEEGDDIDPVLKGMETEFLMSTITRIGSLMKVGFGSAGAEIIRNNLEEVGNKDVLALSKTGRVHTCIFLFCDIRQFTDATECLQEEVFVFTNKIAAVVHSMCNAYGGSAIKNIGDAFLISWLLDEGPAAEEEDEDGPFMSSISGNSHLHAKDHQADKALLSCIKIQMALHYDHYFLGGMNELARNRLVTKLSKRKGPIVQMGFGLHAGKAFVGAIGSQRKLDATYISESVERAEFLESSSKTYGVPLLMSGAFFNLLDSSNSYRCRKIDQIIIRRQEDEHLTDPHEFLDHGEKMSIYTFDMDIEALWRPENRDANPSFLRSTNDLLQLNRTRRRPSDLVRRVSLSARDMPGAREMPGVVTKPDHRHSEIPRETFKLDTKEPIQNVTEETPDDDGRARKRLVLPEGACHYDSRAWLDPDIKKIRHNYVSDGIFFPKYKEGLKSYCSNDWTRAKECFELVLAQRDDGPSRYFLGKIAEHGCVPPGSFVGYTMERV